MAEAVRFFDVELDITDCEVLYDYDKGERIERPDGGWNNSARKALNRRASLDHVESDKGFKLRVGLMDRTWMEKRILEKRAGSNRKENRNDNPNLTEGSPINFEDEDYGYEAGAGCGMQKSEIYLPRRVLPVYHPGDVVKGTVILDLANPTEGRSLSINFNGKTQMQKLLYTGQVVAPHRKSEDYIDETLILWKTTDGAPDVTDAFSLLSTNSQAVSKRFPAGRSHFPFEFTIPPNSPRSIPQLIPSTDNYAYLAYRLKAVIDPGRLNRDIIFTRGIWVDHPYDIASIPGHMKPASVEEIHKTGVLNTSGQVVLRATLPRTAWVRGEPVSLKVEVENKASSEIASIDARIMLHGKARLGACKITKMTPTHGIDIKGLKCKDGPVRSGQSLQYQWELPFDFSESGVDSNLVPIGPLDGFKLIDVHYDVVITATRKGFHRNVTLSIPITVGSYNSGSDM